MDYATDSSGTDDDLPPPHQNRFARNAQVAGNGRSVVGASAPYHMETQIHLIEQEAYCCVLRAFKAQSDAITWEKESLITELRKELRVSDEEHRELLSRVNNDDMIRRIREWRKSNALQQPGMMSSSQPVNQSIPSPTVSASRKKQKTSQSAASLSVGAPSPALHPSSSALKRGPVPGVKGNKPKSSVQVPYPAQPGRPQIANNSSAGAYTDNDHPDGAKYDPLIGREVWTRWPEDNNFYKAIITDYKEGRHALVYDMHTPDEAWEWVNLKTISPDDIRWEGEDPGITQRVGGTVQGRGSKKSSSVRGCTVPNAGRGRGTLKSHPKKDLLLPHNGIGKKECADIKLLHTDTLIKEVERIFSAAHPDQMEVEKAKNVLKEHEQALVEAIARLEDASDGESDGGDHRLDREQGWRKRPYGEMGEGRGIQGGDKGRFGSEKPQQV